MQFFVSVSRQLKFQVEVALNPHYVSDERVEILHENICPYFPIAVVHIRSEVSESAIAAVYLSLCHDNHAAPLTFHPRERYDPKPIDHNLVLPSHWANIKAWQQTSTILPAMSFHRVDFSATHSKQRTCLSGHIITNDASDDETPQMWCHICGKPTINACPACQGPLRGGEIYSPRQPSKTDSYCMHCGKPLPWTQTRMHAVSQLAEDIELLDNSDRKTLQEILPDIVSRSSTPTTQVSIVKMKSLLKKGGTVFMEVTQKILVDVVSETVKKALFP